MAYRVGIKIWFFIFIVFIVLGVSLLSPEKSVICIPGTLDDSGSCITYLSPTLYKFIGLCSNHYENSARCDYVGDKTLAEPFIFFGIVGLINLAILLITNKKVYESWGQFFIYTLPVLLLLNLLIPTRCDAPLGLCVDRELGAIILSGLFFISSLILIIYKLIQLRKQNPSP